MYTKNLYFIQYLDRIYAYQNRGKWSGNQTKETFGQNHFLTPVTDDGSYTVRKSDLLRQDRTYAEVSFRQFSDQRIPLYIKYELLKLHDMVNDAKADPNKFIDVENIWDEGRQRELRQRREVVQRMKDCGLN
jgi:hypothetical protein